MNESSPHHVSYVSHVGTHCHTCIQYTLYVSQVMYQLICVSWLIHFILKSRTLHMCFTHEYNTHYMYHKWIHMSFQYKSLYKWMSHHLITFHMCHMWVHAYTLYVSQVDPQVIYEWVMAHMNDAMYVYVISHKNASCHILTQSWHIWISHVTSGYVMAHMNK